MKKLTLLFVFVQSLVFANNPVITLNGDSNIEIYMGSTFVDPGATAYDEEDGDISNSIQVSGSVDTNTHGTYVLAYNVIDSDGNSATVVVRTINVVDNFNPSLALTISASFSGNDDVLDIGDTITYDIILSNTGNTDFLEFFTYVIASTDFNDDGVTLTTQPIFVSSSYSDNGYSTPGEQHIYRATYVLTQQALDSGGLTLLLRGHGYWQGETIVIDELFELSFGKSSDEIILDGQISANNNQIKKVADPTDNLDAVNKRYVDQRTLEQTIPGQNIGDLLYWNGQSWQKLSAPQEQSTLRFCEGQLTWGPCAPEVYITHFDSSNSGIGVYGKVLFNGLLYNELGVVYSKTTQSPTVNDSKFLDGYQSPYRNDDFAVYGNDLDLESTYFVRAYCISDKGVSYSKEVFSFTTGSLGNSQAGDYKKYGDQYWTVENYAENYYQDGTEIPQVTDATEWANLTTGAWCYPNGQSQGTGKLYNWYAIMGVHDNDPNTPNKEFAPAGWHIPNDQDWQEIERYLMDNGYSFDGNQNSNTIAKAMAYKYGWNQSNLSSSPGYNPNQNNSSGLSFRPVVRRNIDGSFSTPGRTSIFWSTDTTKITRSIYYNLPTLNSEYINELGFEKYGFSVRFVKD